jgi:Tautomerase enzyme
MTAITTRDAARQVPSAAHYAEGPVPHLAFDLSVTPSPDAKVRFINAVVRHFSHIMDTGTFHIAVSIRCLSPQEVMFGRADPTHGTAILNAALRRGRSPEQKRKFALAVISELQDTLGIPPQNAYLVFTEHDGPDFQMHDGVLPSWSAGDVPVKGVG